MSSELKPHCETCGKPVVETLCPICAKWWADNVPGDEGGKSPTIDEGLVWRNPAPDAAQSAINSGIHRTFTVKAGQRFTFVSDHGGGSGGGGSSNSPDLSAQPTYKIGDRVTKRSGSSWTGRVVGTYSTSLTPEGYAVESENEPGSVQIYPAAALDPASVVGEG